MTRSFSLNSDKTAALILAVSLFLLSLWRFGSNQGLMLLILLVFCHRPWRQQFFSLRLLREPVVLLAPTFFLWCAVSAFYSEAPTLLQAFKSVKLYGKLLFLLIIPVCISITEIKQRRLIENGLIYGVLLNAILSTLYYYKVPFLAAHLAPYILQDITFAINPLQVIYLVVMAIWLLLMRLFTHPSRRRDIVVLILLTAYLWLINLERSGYVLFTILFLFWLYQHFGKKAFLSGCILVPLFFLTLYSFSPKFKARIDLGFHNLVTFHEAASVTDIDVDNSWGLRLAYAKESFEMMKAHPFFGAGAGSFSTAYTKMYPQQQQQLQIHDPDNQYALIAFEFGFVGLLIYFAWLYSIWKFSRILPCDKKNLLRGLLLIFAVMGLSDSALIVNAIGLSFVIWVGLYLGLAAKK